MQKLFSFDISSFKFDEIMQYSKSAKVTISYVRPVKPEMKVKYGHIG